ncbi:hypothetical protein E2C01_050642 [Portunus trituberculatus]|uniref:Uncharacterized protein n=1 Tax=Portunus trituberculatus TaxID=210409 RepID=A0A5B7GHJ8_PORTR|nr:hypothetical protein [Portunus trituberculatus]
MRALGSKGSPSAQVRILPMVQGLGFLTRANSFLAVLAICQGIMCEGRSGQTGGQGIMCEGRSGQTGESDQVEGLARLHSNAHVSHFRRWETFIQKTHIDFYINKL